ncbi:gamma carbonic anhydrase family protein [Halorarum salinum]|uniref:Gamma carbonic anhydrase family protein n=1 Tax=Halorarum salinum TaxID=2743089 RepID=A0A7D5QCM4_9EURY|nr:gamma carbonic anhydrase family protein [Halobaculum salinum]QLG63837.1 gamma carbonic anhydrase family protein [Halobaculum salinum]
MIRSFDGTTPRVAESAYVDEAAVVVGDVVLESGASVWPNATLRGDSGRIVVGERANVQDNAVLHEDAVLEAEATVGHAAVVHAATVGEGALVGMNAVVLDDARVGEEAIVGAGSVVTEGTRIDPRTLAVGTPAESKTDLGDAKARAPAEHYAGLGARYEETSERVD